LDQSVLAVAIEFQGLHLFRHQSAVCIVGMDIEVGLSKKENLIEITFVASPLVHAG